MEQISKRQIGLLGDRIRQSYGDGTGKVSQEDLKMLQEYRLTFRDTIATVFDIVYKESLSVNKKCIVTYRIKRIESIMGKLKRMPKTQLDRLVDIAGCRCILQSNSQVYKLLEKLKNNPLLKIKKTIDYIETPQKEGYKSIHLYVCLVEGDGKQVEIQIRNQEQHNWATLVEISDFIFGVRLKEYKEPDDLLEFHRILSCPPDKLTKKEEQKFFKILKDRDYINSINKVFVRNYINVRLQWLQIEHNKHNNFYLIEAKRGVSPQIDSFSSFTEAESAYFERFNKNANSNIVLTNIPKASYEQISIAYSNYMLSTHQFSDECLQRYQAKIKESIEQKRYLDYASYYYQYCNIVACSLNLLKSEVESIEKNYSQKKRNIKVQEWQKDIVGKVEKLKEKQKKLTNIYRRTLDGNTFFYLYCRIITRVIEGEFEKRLKN